MNTAFHLPRFIKYRNNHKVSQSSKIHSQIQTTGLIQNHESHVRDHQRCWQSRSSVGFGRVKCALQAVSASQEYLLYEILIVCPCKVCKLFSVATLIFELLDKLGCPREGRRLTEVQPKTQIPQRGQHWHTHHNGSLGRESRSALHHMHISNIYI